MGIVLPWAYFSLVNHRPVDALNLWTCYFHSWDPNWPLFFRVETCWSHQHFDGHGWHQLPPPRCLAATSKARSRAEHAEHWCHGKSAAVDGKSTGNQVFFPNLGFQINFIQPISLQFLDSKKAQQTSWGTLWTPIHTRQREMENPLWEGNLKRNQNLRWYKIPER